LKRASSSSVWLLLLLPIQQPPLSSAGADRLWQPPLPPPRPQQPRPLQPVPEIR
jgi:hypothetical protein